MITLYAAFSPNDHKIILALEEMHLPYRLIPIDVVAGAQFDPEFRKISPNGKVPVILDADDADPQPRAIFESGAILIHLAEKTGSFLPQGSAPRSEVLQWLMLQVAGFGPMFGQYTHFALHATDGNDYARARYRTQLVRLLDVYETRLKQSLWIGGEDYSIADMATYPWAIKLREITPEFAGDGLHTVYPALSDWLDRVEVRPATQRAQAAKSDLSTRTTPPERGDPKTIDMVFGRGDYFRAFKPSIAQAEPLPA